MVDSTSSDPGAPVKLAAAAFGGIDLVGIAEPAAERNEPVVGGDDDAPDTRLRQLRHDSRKGSLGVREPGPGSAQETGLTMDVELRRPNEHRLRAVDLLAQGLLAQLHALPELEIGDVAHRAPQQLPAVLDG